MATVAAKFQVGQDLLFTGKPMRVTGLVRYDAGDGKVITRYALSAPGGPLILQDDGATLSLLRPFPAAAPPVAEGSNVSVMGEKYALAGVRRLKTAGATGEPIPGAPKAPLVLSGLLQGKMGSLLREVVPGAAAQTYFLVKPVAKEDVLTGEELAQRLEDERVAAEMSAQAAESEEAEAEQKPLAKIGGWVVTVLVIVGLVWACSGDDESSSSGSVRVGTGHFSHGGK